MLFLRIQDRRLKIYENIKKSLNVSPNSDNYKVLMLDENCLILTQKDKEKIR
jgi:hypothetical protein